MSSKELLLADQGSNPKAGKVDVLFVGDKLAPANGVIFGLALTIPLWAILGGMVWVLRR